MIDLAQAVKTASELPQRPAKEYPQSEESIRLRDNIVAWIADNGQAKATGIAKQFNIHRSTALGHLKQLVEEKALTKKVTSTGYVYKGAA